MAAGYRQVRPGLLLRDDGQVEAVRFYLADGAAFSGWIVRSTTDQYSYSDPIPTKPEAIDALLGWQ
jgi:hypothetical protein